MQIILNGQPTQVDDAITVVELLQRAGYSGHRVAVEINHNIVPRSGHAERIVCHGDQIEIVQAFGGG